VAEQHALSVVRPLLSALDLDGADVTTEAYGEVRTVLAAPHVGGLPTQGWETRFEIGTDGALLSASGMLGGAATGEEYPLIDAQEAFELLNAQPRPDLAALCAPDVPCGPDERAVTGARPGLQLQFNDHGPLLVPAWLFSVRDLPQPVAHVAVDPAFLEPPTAPDVHADPDEPVIVGYGESSSCPHTSVKPLVEETEEVVTVTLEADAIPPDVACTADYVGVDLTVPLSAPLGDRAVVDGPTGQRHDLG
jgi:hypothetical protein